MNDATPLTLTRKVTRSLLVAIAAGAHADERTVRKILSGRPVRGDVATRVLDELRARGLVAEEPAS